jgi:hypothetical protein
VNTNDSLARGLMTTLEANPILYRYISSDPGSTKQPWMGEADRLLYAYHFLSHCKDSTDDVTKESQLYVGWCFYTAVTYFWRSEIVRIAEAMPVPRHTIPKNLIPFKNVWWSLEDPVEVTDIDGNVSALAIGFIMSMAESGNMVMAWIGQSTTDGEVTTINPPLEYRPGTVWPDDYRDKTDYEFECMRSILSLIAFLNSPYVDQHPVAAPRAVRRDIARRGAKPTDLDVNVIQLRQRFTESDTQDHGADVTDGVVRHRYHRWWVRGHIRAQWYQSTKDHKLIWIREHLRGPDGAPMIQHVYEVKR